MRTPEVMIMIRNNLTKLCVDDLLTTTVPLKTRNKPERLFTVNVISSGDPMEIYTDMDGQIVLKKYSPDGKRIVLVYVNMDMTFAGGWS